MCLLIRSVHTYIHAKHVHIMLEHLHWRWHWHWHWHWHWRIGIGIGSGIVDIVTTYIASECGGFCVVHGSVKTELGS